MIKVQNISGEVINVLNVEVINGEIVAEARRPRKTARFYKQYPMMLPNGTSSDGRDKCALAEGWSLAAKSARKPRQPKQQPKNEPKRENGTVTFNRVGDTYEARGNNANIVEEVCGRAVVDGYVSIPSVDFDDVVWLLAKESYSVELIEPDTPKDAKDANGDGVRYQHENANEPNDDDVKAIASALLRLRQGNAPVDAKMVRNIVREELANMPKEKQEVVHKIQVAELPEYEVKKGTNEELFKTIMTMVVNDRIIGRFPWLFGPAGSGKSTLAKMVADALHVPFYSVSSLQQKYELEGYTDAVGEFVQTAFYKAMAEGGVFCFDEISTTSGEVQVAFNTAAAQLVYNFPKMGMVKAHKDFHIIACDNSTGRGGDKRYISRFQLDASTLDRYDFVEVDYSDEHDLNMAAGDKNLVKFIRDMRKVLDASNTTYLATPRASKAIKALQATGMSDKDALWYGLCSGWNKQDIRTFAAKMSGSTEWHKAFSAIVSEL